VNDRVPCRVTLDTQSHYSDLAQAEQPVFSAYDDDLLQDLFGERMWKAAQGVLLMRSNPDLSPGDKKKIEAFYQAAVDQWRDNQ
jgi:hypothetical protein